MSNRKAPKGLAMYTKLSVLSVFIIHPLRTLRLALRQVLLLLSITFILSPSALQSQICRIKILDSETNKPIPFVQIKLLQKGQVKEQKYRSDSLGALYFPFTGPCIIRAEAIGYKLLTDTIDSSASIELFMKPDQIELGDVVVTGFMTPQSADNSIYRIGIIDQKKVESKAASNLSDALKGELAFNSQSSGILGDFIRIQGLTGEHIKLLMDGLPVTGRVAGIIDLGQISSNNIDRIEVVEGPMSVIYGSNALAGVINIISKSPENKKLSGSLRAYYESVGIYNFSGSASKSFRHQSVSFNAGRNFNSGWSPDSESRNKYFKPKEQYLGDFTYKYVNTNLSLTFWSDLLHEQLRDPDSVKLTRGYDPVKDSSFYLYLAKDYFYYTFRANNRFNLVYKPNTTSTIQFQAGYSYYNRSKKCLLKDLVTLEEELAPDTRLSDTTIFHLIPVRVVYSASFNKKYEFQSGIDYSYEQSFGERTGGKRQITDAAIFSTFIYKPFNQFSIQPGIRGIYNSEFKAPVVYSFNVQYKPGRFNLRASIGKGFRAPSLKELYMEFVDNNHHIFGNKDLNAETGMSINLSGGTYFSLSNARFIPELSFFQNIIENAIQLALDPNRPGWGYYFNITESDYKTRGARLELTTYTGEDFSLVTGVNLLGKSSLINTSHYNYSTDIIAQLNYEIPRLKLNTSVNYKYTGRYYDYAGIFDEEFNLTGVQEQIIGGYNSLDVVLSRNFYKDKLGVSTGCKNIFNVTTIDSSGLLRTHSGGSSYTLAGYGRSYFVKLTYRFLNDEK